MEPAVAWLMENFKASRMQAALTVGFSSGCSGSERCCRLTCCPTSRFYKGTIFDNVDHLTSNVMLPLGGVLITVFAAWIMCRNSSADELGGAGKTYTTWRFLARYVAPIAILLYVSQAIGICSHMNFGIVFKLQIQHRRGASMRRVSRARLCRIRHSEMFFLVDDV